MSASERPTETRNIEKVMVRRACDGDTGRIDWARTPPEDDATMRVTTGRSQTGDIWLRE